MKNTYPADMKTLTPDFNTAALEKGESFAVELPANPSTGYAWHFAQASGRAAQTDQKFTPASGAMGAGGTDRRVFRAEESGVIHLQAEYKSFLGAVAKRQDFTITVS